MTPTTPKSDKKTRMAADRKFEAARGIIAKHAPYLTGAIDSLAVVYVDGVGDTFAADAGGRLYCDPAYAAQVHPGQLAFDILHESIGHLLPDHFGRAETMKVPKDARKMWNYAGDMAGNGSCFAIAAKSNGAIRPMGVVVNEQNLDATKKSTTLVTAERFGFPDGLTVEEYYAKLQQNPPPPGPKEPRCGGCAGDTDTTDELEGESCGQGEPVPAPRSPLEQESIRQQVAAAIEEEAASGRGNAPAGLVRWAKLVRRKPRVQWRGHLRTLVGGDVTRARGRADYTFTRLRRQGPFLLPTLFAPTPRVGYGIDTSGSMGDADLVKTLVEARGIFDILQSVGDCEVWVSGCDTEATPPVCLKRWDEKRVVAQLKGGGGTDMAQAIAVFEKVKPTVLVIATDGDTGWPAEKPAWARRVIVCLTRKTHCQTPAWATVVHAYDQKD